MKFCCSEQLMAAQLDTAITHSEMSTACYPWQNHQISPITISSNLLFMVLLQFLW